MKKEEVILEVFDALQEHITKDILPSFIYSHGVMVFPVILQLQAAPKDVIPEIVKTEISEETAKRFLDKLKGFYFKPKHSVMLKFAPTEKYYFRQKSKELTDFSRPLPPAGSVKNQKPIFSLSLKLVDVDVSSEDLQKTDLSINLQQAEENMSKLFEY